MSFKGVLFIDANQYLNLYRLGGGKKLAASVEELRDHILVTKQIVDEVLRNKVKVTAETFPADPRKKLNVPAHLLGTKNERVVHFRKINATVEQTNEDFKKLMQDVLTQVSQSRDEVSKALVHVFSKAVMPSDGELKRARDRKERGNPPGKSSNPLGDELNWEQILSRCQDKSPLWIITRDSDYAKKYVGKMFLNAALYNELAQLYQLEEPPVSCFDSLSGGLRDFVDKTGAKAKELPTRDEADQIMKEEELLTPIDWLGMDDSVQIALQSAIMGSARVRGAAAAIQAVGEQLHPLPDKADKDDA